MEKIYLIFICLFVAFLFAADISAQVALQDSLTQGNLGAVVAKDTVSLQTKSPTGAMLRSLFIPGWGQWYNDKKFKSLVMFCAQGGLLANSIYLNQMLVKSQTDWERNYYLNNRNLSVWWLVGITLFSITDAFVDAHLSDFDESPDLSMMEISPLFTENDVGIKFTLCFCF